MKTLNSPTMQALLKKGLRKAKRTRRPSDGMMISLFTEQKKNGWYYQCEYIHDSRYVDPVSVVVYAFKPPRVFHAKSAEYCLSKAL
jgi:hypothetical protein